jgi:hypothetical protein
MVGLGVVSEIATVNEELDEYGAAGENVGAAACGFASVVNDRSLP